MRTIYRENSDLKDGEKVKINKHDDHVLHILFHRRAMDECEKIETKNAIQEHIKEHADYLYQVYREHNPY